IDTVAHHQAHRAGIIIGPDTFRPVAALGCGKFLSHKIERVVPRYSLKLSGTFVTDAAQRMQKALGMMLPFRIARDLCANHAGLVVIVFRSVNAPNGALVENFDLQRTSRRAVMRTSSRSNANRRTDAPHHFVHRTLPAIWKARLSGFLPD